MVESSADKPRSSLRLPVYHLLAALMLAVLFGLALRSTFRRSPVVGESAAVVRGRVFWHTGRVMPLDQPLLPALLAGAGTLLEPTLPDPTQPAGWQDVDVAALSRDLLRQQEINMGRVLFLARLPFIWAVLLLGALIWRWARESYGPRSAAAALALYAFSPGILARTQAAIPEPGTALLTVIGIYALTRFARRRAAGWLPVALFAPGVALVDSFTTPSAGQRVYLLEHFFQSAPWYYYPVVLGVKIPLPVLLLLAAALTAAAVRGMDRREREIVLPAVLLLGVVCFTPSGEAVRSQFTLPLICLLLLFASRLLADHVRPGLPSLSFASVLIVWLVAVSLKAYPYYFSFFNVFAGGANGGWRVLDGMELDAGQDLPALARYLQRRGAGQVYLSYYGDADPARYGINYVPLPSGSPSAGETVPVEFHPLNPPAGLYAISATNLIGTPLNIHDTFGYFRNRQPLARIGNSIFVYEVPPVSPPISEEGAAWFAQCATRGPAEYDDVLISLTGIPDLHIFTFDCQQSLPFLSTPGWLLLPADIEPVVSPGTPDYTARFEDGSPRYYVWSNVSPPVPPPSTVEFPDVPLPLPVAGYIELLGYEVNAGTVTPGSELILTAWWRVREPPQQPVSIFARLLAQDGTAVASAEGLGVQAGDWLPGAVIIQQHRFTVSPETAPGDYTLAVGLLATDTGRPFPVSESVGRVVDHIALRSIRVVEPQR